MGITNGIITNMGVKIAANGSGDLQQSFGSSQASQAWYFSTAPIKMGAMKKPFLNTTVIFADMNARDTARANANYGLTIPTMTLAEIRAMTGDGWELHRPNGTSYPRRAQDFEGYYHGAPDATLYCTKDSNTIVANTINANALNPCAFFVYQKSGYLKYGRPDPAAGTVKEEDGRNSAQRGACLELKDLKAGGAYIANSSAQSVLTNPHLGILVFNGNTLKGFAGCTEKLVDSQATQQNDMFIVRLAAFSSLGVGTFTGKACIRYGSELGGYNYVPLPAISGVCYNNFTVKIGGQDMYDAYQVNVKEDGTPSAATSAVRLRTTSTTVYVTIKVHNGSGIMHDTDPDPSEINKWILVTSRAGSVTPRDGSGDKTQFDPITSTPYSITPAAMHMDVNGDCLISYQLRQVWSPNPAGQLPISAGSLTLTCNLYYGSTSAPFNRPVTGQIPLDIVYGT